MRFLRSTFGVEINQLRWLARLLSLLPLLFALAIFLLNEDTRSSPTAPLLVMGVVTLFMVSAWRLEKIGGLLTMLGAVALWLSIIINAVLQNIYPAQTAALLGAGLSIPYLIVGWLFYGVGRSTEVSGEAGVADRSQPGRKRILPQFLGLVALLAAFILPFVLGTLVTPPVGEHETVESGPCAAPYPPVGGPVAMPPPTEPLPDSFKGYVLYGYQWEGETYFSIEVGLNRVRTAGEDFYIEGMTFTVQGVDDLKALLRQLPEGEEVIWCEIHRFDNTFVDDIRRFAERQGIVFYVP